MSETFNWDRLIMFGHSKHAYRTKRKKGTFTLHNQVVMVSTKVQTIEVHGIRMDKGIKHGYIRINGKLIRVKQLGASGWISV